MSPVSILPAFFDEALKASYSAADVERIAAGLAQRRATTLRANALLTTRGEIAAALDAAGLPWEEVPWYGDAFVLGGTSKKIEESKAQLEQLDAQVDEATTANTGLKAKYDDNLIEWRNAQGRLSFMGDKSGLVCYLTFDDGPCYNTKKVLDVLDQYDA